MERNVTLATLEMQNPSNENKISYGFRHRKPNRSEDILAIEDLNAVREAVSCIVWLGDGVPQRERFREIILLVFIGGLLHVAKIIRNRFPLLLRISAAGLHPEVIGQCV